MVSGTRSQTLPVRKAPARSAEPIPVAKPHGPAHHRVAVGAHHQIARAHAARLQGHLKADAAAHGKQLHAVLGREGLHAGVEPEGRGGGGGRVVVPGQ